SVLIQPEIIVYPADLDRDFTTAPFTLASVNAEVGSGPDNIVTLKGINYSGDGGGAWMGIDYVQLNPLPVPVFPLAIGKDDNGFPVGDGGGANSTFVQEAGVNGLPGNPSNPEIDQQADDDYYFAGIYTSVISSVTALYGPYEPIGIVPRNEEAAERAFAGSDNDLRYHFNLPDSLKPTDKIAVKFDAVSLHEDGQADPRYGIEIYFNGVLVQPELVIHPADLDTDFTTPAFTLASVNAEVGSGKDNVLALKGVNYNADGGGNWMGIDYVQVDFEVAPELKLSTPSISNGKVTLTWTGTGNLEWAPTISGPWTPITPPPASGYTEDVEVAGGRYYHLIQ
ncbi:MAG TPA: hypothetical protein DCE44_25115, partial [Verrucomicrobiales bacterium]|nr:hypothetical protein [Verrucomicrobiales bacterium]